METIIEFKNIKKAYGDKVVLEDFNLIVEKGEFCDNHWLIGLWKNNSFEND